MNNIESVFLNSVSNSRECYYDFLDQAKSLPPQEVLSTLNACFDWLTSDRSRAEMLVSTAKILASNGHMDSAFVVADAIPVSLTRNLMKQFLQLCSLNKMDFECREINRE